VRGTLRIFGDRTIYSEKCCPIYRWIACIDQRLDRHTLLDCVLLDQYRVSRNPSIAPALHDSNEKMPTRYGFVNDVLATVFLPVLAKAWLVYSVCTQIFPISLADRPHLVDDMEAIDACGRKHRKFGRQTADQICLLMRKSCHSKVPINQIRQGFRLAGLQLH
jgi:hypothetical protein